MRSRNTNVLQAIVLVTGAVYIIIGLSFLISPVSVLQLFAENISDNWLDLVRDNELVAPLYHITRGFAALLFSCGLAMVLPLFDPLRYRGLIYFSGIIFPFFSSIIFMRNGLLLVFLSDQPGEETSRTLMELIRSRGGHTIVLILGLVFTVVFLATLVGILITRKQAKQGIE
ncbi:MAG: hypothetical protein JXA20_15130 [Spirochaetes bacterium]|nr:hypothetical protein [Spirochaetota bacterium]